MAATYLALVKAEYDYEATAEEELTIKEEQLLYVLEYTDDEWWKVRVKLSPSDGVPPEDAPTGLVPATYVTPCEPIRQVTALYDYEATSEEEMSIKEDQVYDLYETDGDWTLVGAKDAKEVGYAPTTYLEDNADAPGTNGHAEASVPVPPPAPPLPTAAASSSNNGTPRKSNGSTSDKVLTWSNVTELEGKKKKKGTLGVGNGALFFASDSDKAPVQKKDLSILKDIQTEKSKHIKLYFTNGELLQFTVPKDDMEAITTKIENSREFAQNGGAGQGDEQEEEEEDTYVPPPPPPPPSSGGAKGFGFLPPPPRRMVSTDSEDSDDDEPPSRSTGGGGSAIPAAPPPPPAPPAPPAAIPQAPPAPKAPVIPVAPPAPAAPVASRAPGGGGKRAKAEYDFTASEPEELSLTEGETLYVLDDSAEDWWKVRNERGEEGEVPASYVELLEDTASGPTGATGPSAVEEDADEEAARRLQEEEKAEAKREKERLRLKKLEEEARGLGAFDFQPPPMRKSTASSATESSAAARAAAAASAKSPSPPPPPPPPPAPPAAAVSPPPSGAAPSRQDSQDTVREQRRERHRQREMQRAAQAAAASSQAARPIEKTKPSPARVRTWVDRTGAFKVDAEFVGLSGAKNEKIRLHKLNGVVIEVPLDKMSQDDIRLIEHMMRKRLASSPDSADRRHSHRSDRNRGERDGRSREAEQSQRQHQARPPSSSAPGGKRVSIAPTSGRKDQTDWFEWFLNAGCDIDDCERYARNFEKDRIDVDIVGDLEAATLRNLGLREGDIIRVRKYIAKKTGGSGGGTTSAPSSSAQRGPPPPDKDASTDREQQLHDDEELARKLQEEMNAGRDGSGLFTNASGGVKNTRRGRPQPKTAPSAASFDSIASSLTGADRSSTPSNERVRSPDTTKERRPSSTAPPSSGFDDDAWTVKPSPSTAKPPSPVLIDASSSASSSARATPSPAPVVSKDVTGLRAQTASPASMPSSSKESSSAQALTDAYLDSIGLGKRQVTEYGSGQPARQTASPAPAPPPAPQQPQQQQPQQTGYAPQSQVSPQQTGYYQQQSNGPRPPPAPIPLNQQLLNPLIPTQTGMTGFIPTRNQQSPMPMMPQQTSYQPQQQQPMQTGFPGQSPFGNQFAVSSPPPMMQQPQYGGMMQAQPTGYPLTQQMSHLSMQPTGMPYQATPSPQPQPQMQIPQAPPPPPMPQQQQPQPTSQSSSANDYQPASVFAKMKAGQFAKPESSAQPQQKYDALRPQPTSFGMGMGGFGQQQPMQPQPTGFPGQMQPLQAQPTGFAPGGYINMPQAQQSNMMYPQQTGYPYRPY